MKTGINNTLSISDKLYYALSRYKGIGIETELTPYLRIVENIKKRNYKNYTQTGIKKEMQKYKRQILDGVFPQTLAAPVFALVSEVCVRTLDILPHTEQLVAAVVLAQGKIAQMQNGEGKTLAAVFPACLYALCGKGVHILTANDYLARRDAEWMKRIYEYLGITCAYIQSGMCRTRRKRAYRADVTYLTAEQGGFDLLRDDRCRNANHFVHRNFNVAIVDEADFILIDQARFPLVIAGRAETPQYDPYIIDSIAQRLKPQIDFRIAKRMNRISLTVEGERRVRTFLRHRFLRSGKYHTLLAAVHAALCARYLLQRDEDYLVKQGNILPVDEVTGRAADNKHWPYGIGRALQAKERLKLQPADRILGSITIQNYIMLYPFICAMTATAVPSAGELATSY
jgi:preprotein translocase subunit SecA